VKAFAMCARVVSGTARLFYAKWQCAAAPVDPAVAGRENDGADEKRERRRGALM
jgi:hypothetical protein